jgi:tetratricopeptide (TPR) repeat protein
MNEMNETNVVNSLRTARTCLLEGKSKLYNAGDIKQVIWQLEKGLETLSTIHTGSQQDKEELRKIQWQLLYLLGRAHATRPNSNPEKSIKCWQQALDVIGARGKNKRSKFSELEREAIVQILSRLGDAFLKMKKPHQALKYYEEAANLNTSNQQAAIWIQDMLGSTYLALGRHMDAVKALQSVIAMDPDFQHSDAKSVYYHLSKCYYEQSEYTEALGYGLQALTHINPKMDRFPQTHLIHQGLGYIYFAMSSYGNAIKHFRESLRFAPLNAPERAEIIRHLNVAKEKLD